MTNKTCIKEYTRVMNSVDTTQEVREHIIDSCVAASPSSVRHTKAAVVAISGAAVVAAALGIKKYRSLKSRT